MIVILNIFTLVFQFLLLVLIVFFSKQTNKSKTIKYTTPTFYGYSNGFDIDIFIQKLMNT